MNSGFHLEIDTDAEIAKIMRGLNAINLKAPSILKNAINATARKVRTQILKDAKEKYSIKNKSDLKNEAKGGPKLYTATDATLTAEIKASGAMQDIMAFLTKPNTATGAAAAKVLNTSAYTPLEVRGLKAFVATFRSGHTAIVQREGSERLPMKKLLSPAVPIMLGNAEIQEKAEAMAYDILQTEITKRIDKINDGV